MRKESIFFMKFLTQKTGAKLRSAFLWPSNEDFGVRYHVIAFLYVLAGTLPDAIVSIGRLFDMQTLGLALQAAIICLASFFLLINLIAPADTVREGRAIEYFWAHKKSFLAYLAISGFVEIVAYACWVIDPYGVQTIVMAAKIITSIFLFLTPAFFSYWSERRDALKAGKTVRSTGSFFSPFRFGSLFSVPVVALVVVVYLSLIDLISKVIFPMLGVQIVGTWFLYTPAIAWLLQHYSYRVHKISGEVVVPSEEQTRKEKYKKQETKKNEKTHVFNLSNLKRKEFGVIGGIALVVFGFTYYFAPGITLARMQSGFAVQNALAEKELKEYHLQTALQLAHAMQVQALTGYSYLLYEEKNFPESRNAIQNAIQSDPGLPENYLIDGYDAIRMKDVQGAESDISVLKNLRDGQLAYWLQMDLDRELGHDQNVLTKDQNLVELIGVPSGLLPFIPKTIPTSTKSQNEECLVQIHQADSLLLQVGNTALQKGDIGQALTISQELYSVWQTGKAPYVIPGDAGTADIWLATMHSRIQDFTNAVFWLRTALGTKNALSPRMFSRVNQALLAYSALGFVNNVDTTGLLPGAGTDLASGFKAYSENDFAKASSCFRDIVNTYSSSPYYPTAVSALAVTDYQLKQTGGAVRYATLATRMKNSTIQAIGYTVLGNVLLDHKGNAENAIADYQKATQLNPEEYLAWYYMGNLYMTQKEYVKAFTAYGTSERAFERDQAQGHVYATGAPSEGLGLINVTPESGRQFAWAEAGVAQAFKELQKQTGGE